jgi:hypothetical protein
MAITVRNSAAVLLSLALLALSLPMPAPAAISRLPMAFPDGATRALATGRIAGRASNDHIVRARAGQALAVRLDADSAMAYFNVLPPGSDEAIFIGSAAGNEFRGVLAQDGDYTLRVYLMAAGARRGESSNYTLRADLTDAPATPFDKTISLHGIGFRITSPNRATGNTLRIETTGLALDNTPVERAIAGPVTGAEVADLDADRSPEVYVFVQPADAGGRMALAAFSANRRKSLGEITLPAIEDSPGAADGFVGPEQMAVVESMFVRRFAVDGGARTRQMQYRLVPGEAGWRLKLDRTEEF